MFWGKKQETRKLVQDSLIDEELNVIVLGDSQVGKTTLLEEYCGTRDEDYVAESTNGLAIHCKRLKIGQRSVTTVFHDFGGDTAQRLGQEFFLKDIIARSAGKSETCPIAAVIVVFDCTSKNSLYQMKGWLQWFYSSVQDSIRKVLQTSTASAFERSLSEIPVLVVGNKIDLMNSEPFYFFESSRLPKDQRDQLSNFLENAARRLRNHLCMTDCENLLFTSSECNPFKLSEVFDRMITAIYNKANNGIMNDEFSICGISMIKCIKGKAFKEEIFHNSLLSSLKNLFFKKEEPYLPL